MLDVLPEVLSAFPIGTVQHIVPVTDGLVHATYKVETDKGAYILQRLNPIVGECVVEDIERVTDHLAFKGIGTFRVMRTKDSAVSYFADGAFWRLITYVEGVTVRKNPTLIQAENAGRFVARFHEAFLEYPHEFAHQIPDFHDTDKIMQKLETMPNPAASNEHDAIESLKEQILDSYRNMVHSLDSLPLRIGHGDLKISNIRFNTNLIEVVAIIDLDTMGYYRLPIEVGDMLRSWCKSDMQEETIFVPERWVAALRGYATAQFVLSEEWDAFQEGFMQITLELAARFLVDSVEVFAYDSTRFPSLFAQNIDRCKRSLSLFTDFTRKRHLL
jgi:Ser/Thr protein kinase RdoA (MazF antagonist)